MACNFMDFIETLSEIDQELTAHEFKRILQFMSDKIKINLKEKLENNKDLIELYEIIKERGLVTPPSESEVGDSNYLIDILTKINRIDLANRIARNFGLVIKEQQIYKFIF